MSEGEVIRSCLLREVCGDDDDGWDVVNQRPGMQQRCSGAELRDALVWCPHYGCAQCVASHNLSRSFLLAIGSVSVPAAHAAQPFCGSVFTTRRGLVLLFTVLCVLVATRVRRRGGREGGGLLLS